ncbi:hypothetical protein [Hymenobacter jeollabukensis]|uniref:DUF4890 domain-containing protein n=1 Tax=Hymenobacter jeollabukensis TaxID=2025313 RepID=A0A5R8WVR6_9BACT|nr:hypothetical protein [Hymenobacter jeollabukensis]TLM95593.1 hypothetical protein FDY95_07360 [Hymenobacter jeollabukensis]
MQTSWLRGALGAALVGVLHLTAIGTALPARAQEPATRPQGRPAGRGPGKGQGHNPEQQADDLAKKLKLNAKQKGEVAAIFKSQHEQMPAQRGEGPAADREKGMEQMRRLDADTDAKLQAVLTPAQYQQYQAQKPRHGGPRNGKGDKDGKAGKGGRPPKDATGAATN